MVAIWVNSLRPQVERDVEISKIKIQSGQHSSINIWLIDLVKYFFSLIDIEFLSSLKFQLTSLILPYF